MAISNIEMHKRVTRHLENSHMIISPENEWFKQCVDFFISDNPNCDVKDLSAMVVEQLSLSDFQEIGLFSLPANLNNCDKKILTGKYCLQVNTILNVGQSCYSQYNILVKRDTSNTEIGDDKPAPWEPKTHRMLKMMCSDGQQDIVAMEYEPLQCLKEPFIPGFKIVVVGPVEYRKGVLLLKSTNVHFIGGEVEHLLIKNAPLNVLCRALNKPELENPYIFSNIEVENAVMEVHEQSDPPRQIENVSTIGIREQNSVIAPTSTNQSNNNNRTGSGIITYDDFFDGDDDLLYLTQMAEIETRLTQSDNVSLQTFGTDRNNTKVNKTTISVPKNNNITNKKPAATAKQTKISDMLGPSTSTAFRGSVAESTRCQNDRTIENNSRNVTKISAKRIASSPVYTETKRPSIELQRPDNDWGHIDIDIDVLNPLIKVLNSASIVKNSKIQVKQNEWICSGIVMDESKHEEAEFSSEVLERLIGISSEEVLQLKNNPSNCAPLKEKIEKGIKGAYRKLHLFKDATHLIGPNPCYCVSCYQTIEKQTSTMNYSNPACFINSCDQTACCVFDSMSYDELNTLWIVSKINFRLLSNKEQLSRNICFCKAHYDQLLLISQCELCGNRSMDMVTLQEDNVRECQLILNEDNVPVTIKSGIFICKSCNFYILLRSNTTITTITRELQRHIDTTITRIKNKNISVTNGLECIQLSMVIFLPKNISNFFTLEFFTMTSQIVSSLFNLDTFRTLPLLVSSEIMNIIESITVSITTSIETGLVTEKLVAALLKNKWDLKFSVENSTALTLNRRNEPAFLDENSSVPRIKNPNILSVKPTTPVDEPTVADHKPLHNKSLVFEMNQTRSTSSRTEFPELSSQRADPTTLSSPKPNMIRLFKNLKVPYSNGMDFVNHLINLETCRNLGNLTVGNNKTTHRQRTSDTVTTSSHIHCSLEHKEYQTISHADDDETDPSN